MKLEVTESQVETALGFLVETAPRYGQLVEQVGRKETQLKNVEALLVVKYHTGGTAATVCRDYARAEQRWIDASTELAIAQGILAECRERRDAAETTISVYQSMVKDRQGARP